MLCATGSPANRSWRRPRAPAEARPAIASARGRAKSAGRRRGGASRRRPRVGLAALAGVLLLGPAAWAQTSTVPGPIAVEATQVAAGIEWLIDGDTDQDCVVLTRFRLAADSSGWREGQPLFRVEPGIQNEHQVDPGNLLAGSLFDLEPASEYVVRLVLSDPDGGSADTTLPFSTRAWPQVGADARVRYVTPGSGGGSGTSGDPFRGIAAADAAAAPGDLFLLAPGVYTDSLDLQASGTPDEPIVWSGVDRDLSVIDGQSACYHLIELSGNHDLQFRNLTMRNPRSRCLRASGTRNIAVIDCRIDFSTRSGDEMFGLDFRDSEHENVFVSGNEIVGPLRWEEGRNEDHYALLLVGRGHVVRYNRIHGVFDAVMVGSDRDSIVTSNCDVYGNELYDCTDDGVEFDASRHNIRCHDNRITNVLCGFSCQPVYGGPIYMLRNVVYNWQLKPLKFHGDPTGMIVVQNTMAGADERGWGGGEWRRVILRNNLILGGSAPGHSGDPICLDTAGDFADFDHDGWYQADPARFARFNYVSYPTLAAFQAATGLEEHGVLVDYGIFVDAEEPLRGPYLGAPTFFPPYPPGDADVRLQPGASAVDAGLSLANLNDGWLGTAPDLGAYEVGGPSPGYGPAADPVSDLGGAPRLPLPSGPTLALRVRPDPSVGNVRIDWPSVPAGSNGLRGAVLCILDPAGRCVRRTRDLRDASWLWDGRDQRGRPTPSGVYWARLDFGGAVATGRIVRAR